MCRKVQFVYGCGHPHASRRRMCAAHRRATERGTAEPWEPCVAGRPDLGETRNVGGRTSLCPRCRGRRELDRRESGRRDRDALRPISGSRGDSRAERAARRRYDPYYR